MNEWFQWCSLITKGFLKVPCGLKRFINRKYFPFFQQQNLFLRTAELSFGVLRAIDNLNASISEEKAIQKQLDQAQQRYDVGLSAITGVQEAQLQYDLSKAARINNEGNLFSAREALNALIGREVFSLTALGDNLNISEPFPNSKEEWVKTALENNYQ